jgi:uncharacterized repeat protein (TIGR03803 family)
MERHPVTTRNARTSVAGSRGMLLALLFVPLSGCGGASSQSAPTGGFAAGSISTNALPQGFEMPTPDAKSKETVLYSFKGGGRDGAAPNTPLVTDSKGALYGTTYGGGTSGYGTVFKLTPAGSGAYTERVLYSFNGGAGANPEGTLLIGANGVLYGTTKNGGDLGCSCGVLFALSPLKSGRYGYATLYQFVGGSDGMTPTSGLVADNTGTLYGTTEHGGGSGNCGSEGCGTVFEYNPSGPGYKLLAAFDGSKGALPVSSPLVVSANGYPYPLLLGTTSEGGANQQCTGGCGAVYGLFPSSSGGWTLAAAYYFGSSATDGTDPQSPLIQIATGSMPLFAGNTKLGGDPQCDCGTVFELGPLIFGQSLRENVLHRFLLTNNDGRYALGGLVLGQKGELYGMTYGGGRNNAGSAFALRSSGSNARERVFFNFGGAHGAAPLAGFLRGTNQTLFGTASQGGSSGVGTVFIFNNEQ